MSPGDHLGWDPIFDNASSLDGKAVARGWGASGSSWRDLVAHCRENSCFLTQQTFAWQMPVCPGKAWLFQSRKNILFLAAFPCQLLWGWCPSLANVADQLDGSRVRSPGLALRRPLHADSGAAGGRVGTCRLGFGPLFTCSPRSEPCRVSSALCAFRAVSHPRGPCACGVGAEIGDDPGGAVCTQETEPRPWALARGKPSARNRMVPGNDTTPPSCHRLPGLACAEGTDSLLVA